MRSTEFPTPLKDAECVSLVMAYELYRASQSEEKLAASLEWIACQLDSDNCERKPACLFSVSFNWCTHVPYYSVILKVH